tara:strand:- start:44 stop:247 length:204 start_codon:yes stop_codon:yes gene_type:complete
MKLKKSRKERKCHDCKTLISKGDSYGQKSITLGSKKDGMTDSFDRDKQAFVIHQMRVNVSLCAGCAK